MCRAFSRLWHKGLPVEASLPRAFRLAIQVAGATVAGNRSGERARCRLARSTSKVFGELRAFIARQRRHLDFDRRTVQAHTICEVSA